MKIYSLLCWLKRVHIHTTRYIYANTIRNHLILPWCGKTYYSPFTCM